MTIKPPNVTLSDALTLWDVLTDGERRSIFADFWQGLEAVRAGDTAPIRSMAESWPVTVLAEKVQPGFHAMARERLARGPVPARDLVDVEDVISLLHVGPSMGA